MDTFVECVNHVIQHHTAQNIESFRVDRTLLLPKTEHLHRTRLPPNHSAYLDRWIQFAADKKVQKLDLIMCIFDPRYEFPYLVFPDEEKEQTLKHLSLGNCILNLPSKFTNFSSLVSLTLNRGPLTQVNLTNILSNCLSLEWLSIRRCVCPEHLKFTSLKLKHLNIINHFPLRIDIVDLENLVSFEFSGIIILKKFVCNKNAQVRRACFYGCYPPGGDVDYAIRGRLARDFPQLETLLITSFPTEVNLDDIHFDNIYFSNIIQLIHVCFSGKS